MSAQHGFLNSSLLAKPLSEENSYTRFRQQQHIQPDQSGSLNSFPNNPHNTGTIPSSNASRFDLPPPWPPQTLPARHLPYDHNEQLPPLPPTPQERSLNYEPSSTQPQISFEDQPLFPPPARPAPPQRTSHSHPNFGQQHISASHNTGVDAIIQRLGHNTTASQFTHRLPAQQPVQSHSQRPPQAHVQYQQYIKLVNQHRALERQLQLHKAGRLIPENMKEEELNEWLQVAGVGSEFSSPAFTHIHDPTVNLGTVSPQDIFANLPGSTPMSATFMSPFLDDDSSFEGTPIFGADGISGTEEWPSLFPDENPGTKVQESPYEAPLDDFEIDTILRAADDHLNQATTSSVSPSASPSVSRSSVSGRKSSLTGAGVRKRVAPLPPIVVEDLNDTVAVKRARNTLAARKSREKKVKKMEEMEQQIEELKQQVEYWKQRAIMKGGVP